ncbi:tRNA wybutosine-synthesizing protein 4 [Pundamilia nyererei]|uniref:tRNA wybutosine-synthesizing protein 4 n=1 Tax=Pundamilia nyererei TaxID=303518 RepID=A0A9Y3RN76_9CICH|nr:PREDICTED: tRNA wybutosine-synthesizing protein 4 [Pundamilia nyererei]
MPATNRKAQKKGRDTAVQGTNDSSVVSKVSAAAQGYFNDVFLQHFVCKVARRAPLINRGYYVRWKAVDHCVRKFLQITEKCPKRQVSSGLDWAAPTLILSEVVLTYMETKWSDAIIGWAAKLLPQSLFVMYEQIHPHDPFGQIMQEHFQKLNSTLHALRQYPDTAAQRHRFLDKGWEECVCLDMNNFLFGLVPEEERCRLESLEPFDEYEEWHQKCSHYFILTASRGSLMAQALLPRAPESPVPSVGPSWSTTALSVRTTPVCVEGLGMASASVRPGWVLLTGGSSRGGRRAAIRLLLREQEGWRSVSVEPSADVGVRLYHTVTPIPGVGAVVFGGRSSPLNPVRSLFKMTFSLCGALESGGQDAPKLCMEEMMCTGSPPPPRWRHSATLTRHRGREFVFVFGGKNQSGAVLGDGYFLSVDQQHWTEIPVEGVAPEARHSHSACSYKGGGVVFGGLSRAGVPLDDTVILTQTERGFCWERIDVQPPPVPRYSHCAHVSGEKLVVVGGVWLHSDGVPGVVVINITTCSSMEYSLDTTSVPWPLMLHSFCSEMTDSEDPELLLIGGGGNCFSFGTHWNPQPVTVDLKLMLG